MGEFMNHRHIPEFVDYLRAKKLEARTVTTYGKILFKWRNEYPGDINSATEDEVLAFLGRIRGTGSWQRVVTIVFKNYYRWLGRPLDNEKVPTPKMRRRQILPITADEFVRIRDAAKPTSIKNLLTFLLATGVRISEALGARRADFVLDRVDHGQPRPVMMVRGKGGTIRTVPLTSPGLVSWLNDRLTVSDGPFAGIRYWQARYGFNQAAIRAGVQRVAWEENGIRGMYATLHGIRRLVATRMLEQEIPMDVIRQFLGHASVETTQRYAQTSEARMWQHMNIRANQDSLGQATGHPAQ